MSKRVAVISPVSLLEKYSTDFHLVLTQYYLRNAQYREFYLRRRVLGDFIILDNGAAEIKAAVAGSSMMYIVKELKPDIVVAPDVIYDRAETVVRTAAFLEKYKSDLNTLSIKVMAVPQGVTSVEWYKSYQKFNADSRIDWLGISMFYTPKFNRRLEALELIAPTVQKPCHLLGLWDNPYDLLEERKFDFVYSIDTAKMIEFAFEGLTLAEWAKHRHIDDDWYFGLSDEGTTYKHKLITKNVNDFVRLFKEGKR